MTLGFGTGGVPVTSPIFFPPIPINHQENAGSLADYIGAGQVSFVFRAVEDSNQCFSLLEQNGIIPTCFEDLRLTTALTYTFVPVPEPASLAILISGLAILVPLRRRRRAVIASIALRI